ncbi:MAG: aldo/keto reductase [Bacteroidota bacterium]|nr:aldo/keto reductase [Bacteroidota bacterium]
MGQLARSEVNQFVEISPDSRINFIGAANRYSEGLSETLLGESLKKPGTIHQHEVIANTERLRMGLGANQAGLSRLHTVDSMNDSPKRLRFSPLI